MSDTPTPETPETPVLDAGATDAEVFEQKRVRLEKRERLNDGADLGGGAITTQCAGTHEQKAGYHKLTGPGGGVPPGVFNPQDDAHDQKLALTWSGTESPIQNRRYRLRFEDGRTVEGVTDDRGNTETLLSDLAFARYRVELLPEQNSDPN